ncbi:terminase large subunit domain-containing protein [Sphingobium yanoikuyae]|uniref:terminase large subunit domain-containing protein n=1 Tax=Sphingobium yanoikuyae TaxID=13690 RepID=UPI000846ADE7|nr:terminase family protein [Sphingobium yanoikuyae]
MTRTAPPPPNAPLEGEIFLNPRLLARSLYWRGWDVPEIVEDLNRVHGLGLNKNTVASWKRRDGWDQASPRDRCEEVTATRYCMLVAKEVKTGQDFKEIDLLGRKMTDFARQQKYLGGGNEADLNPNIAARNAGPKKKARQNLITRDMVEQMRQAFLDRCFGYQLEWWENRDKRTRFLLKSRQIGATDYFAHEAFIDALETGRNQIFLSASRRQANIFRRYIIEFCFRVTGIRLTGEHITIDRGEDEDGVTMEMPTIFFLGANYRTAQGEHGNFYYDECFWSMDFEQTDDVASGMASQKRYRETYFSTPSTKQHQAYKKWSGEKFNQDRPKKDWIKVDTSYAALKDGAMGADGIWRQVVTIEDAEAKGCDLFDVEELRRRKSPEVFENLYMCEFIDDAQSMFPWALMRRCMVDSEDKWDDFHPYALRPYAGDVYLGYDPNGAAEGGDKGALMVLAAPKTAKAPWRVLERHRYDGNDYMEQADKILRMCDRYNIIGIAIDASGIGDAVWQLVVKRFATAKKIVYSVETKTLLVHKSKNIIRAGRLEFDAGMTDIIEAFVSIHAELTNKQRNVTYVADRAGGNGHADVAWATMNALSFEEIDGALAGGGNYMETF